MNNKTRKKLNEYFKDMARNPLRAFFLFVAAILVMVGLTAWSFWHNTEMERVAKIIDGDTIVLENGEVIRYIGIDTPEISVPVTDLECYGPEATERNRELVEGRVVKLIRDVKNRDRYGRLLRYIYVDDISINNQLVEEGYAKSLIVYPNVSYAEEIKDAEEGAKSDQRGMWSEDNCPQ